ncbi:MAG: hypothetical protein ACXVXI_02890 [Mycobacteriaceae bacterium]
MTDQLWLNALIIIGLIGGAEEAIRRILARPLIRTYRKFERFLDTWNGEPERDGLPARPGLVDRVIAIEYQVHNNGGGSMKDAVDRIDEAAKVAAESARMAAEVATANKEALDLHIEQSAELLEQGRKSETEIRGLLKHGQEADDEIRGTIATLADAVKIAAQSTPPEEHS